jgi:predicted DNA-binding protein (MmcQ/YjbR family)
MRVDAIREYCLGFGGTTEKLQWGDSLCFKVGGKIFTIAGLDTPRVCFKCTPEVFAELIEREDIRPAPYFGRYKWVLLERLDALGWNELREVIGQSYAMIAAKTKTRSPTKLAGKPSRKKARKSKPAGKKARSAGKTS